MAVAALLRFLTLHGQSYDYDELQTVRLLREGFGGLLHGIARDESTPPLYYAIAWVWSNAFGTGETGLRALSAVFGTATVGVTYTAARAFAARRPALLAAAIVAVSPWLVWYSQEARAYALLALLGALSFWFFAGALDGRRGHLAGWAATSALALTAHYFAVFLVAPEAVWLIARRADRRQAVVAALCPAFAAAALLPLALHQRAQGHGDEMISISGSLALRVAQLPKQSLVGYDGPAKMPIAAVALALALAALALLVRRGTPGERSAARLPAAIAVVVVAIPIALAAIGLDYVVARNVIVVCVPAAIVIALGFRVRAARPAGSVAAGALLVVLAATTLAVASNSAYQRDDWRGAARSLGPPRQDRVVVVTPSTGPEPFAVYLAGLRRDPARGAAVHEVDVVAIANVLGRAGHGRALPPADALPRPARGFRAAGRTLGATYETLRFLAPRPLVVAAHDLTRGQAAALFFQPAAR